MFYTKIIFNKIPVYNVKSKRIKTEVAFTKREMNNQHTYSREFSIDQSTSEISLLISCEALQLNFF